MRTAFKTPLATQALLEQKAGRRATPCRYTPSPGAGAAQGEPCKLPWTN